MADWLSTLAIASLAVASVCALVIVAGYLRRMVPTALGKVPFTPHALHCLLVARDLEYEGIPVNLTSTFSARQAVVAALVTDATGGR